MCMQVWGEDDTHRCSEAYGCFDNASAARAHVCEAKKALQNHARTHPVPNLPPEQCHLCFEFVC
jgi:hypothetical protein